jgi:hypothetical protein
VPNPQAKKLWRGPQWLQMLCTTSRAPLEILHTVLLGILNMLWSGKKARKTGESETGLKLGKVKKG